MINGILYKIHDWGHAQHHPVKRIFLTRILGIGCAVCELLNIFIQPIVSACHSFKKMDKLSLKLQNIAEKVLRQFLGFLSTIVCGIFVSPELNYRIHLVLHP